MRAIVYSNTLIIGHTDLEIGDESMGCVFGNFIPTNDYYKSVRKSVWRFWSINRPDYKRWNSLNINVRLENGCFLHPMGGCTFDDSKELSNEKIRIDIAGLSRYIIQDFYQSDPPAPFVEDPWVTISIEQKLLFETELQKEIKNGSSRCWRFIKSTTRHVLTDYKCSAVCKDCQSDDILFSIHGNNGSDKTYALVHLTFSGEQEENAAFPRTTLFDSFDAFKFERMYPDKGEWKE